MNFRRRVGRLESAFQVGEPQVIRAIIALLGESGGLQICTRSLGGGILTEIVRIKGSREGISDEEIQRFVDRFPVTGPGGREVALPSSGQIPAGSRR
jgi:hypothetical protein